MGVIFVQQRHLSTKMEIHLEESRNDEDFRDKIQLTYTENTPGNRGEILFLYDRA